jgi:hypothetical protein
MYEANGTFMVKAEVARPKQGGPWPLRPDMSAKMTIQLK